MFLRGPPAGYACVSLRGAVQKNYLFSDYFGSPFRLRSWVVERDGFKGNGTRIAGSMRVMVRDSFGAGGGSEICFLFCAIMECGGS